MEVLVMATIDPHPPLPSPRTLTSQEAVQGARNALAVANVSVESQLHVYRALQLATRTLREDPSAQAQAAVFDNLTSSRGKLLCSVIEETCKRAEAAYERHGAKMPLMQTLRAGIDIFSTVAPEAAPLSLYRQRLETLQQQVPSTPDAQPARPFFARFLEHQNRQRITTESERHSRTPDEVHITLKSPSDHEDSGGRNLGHEVVVTLKAPSDHEDSGPQPSPMTRKFPSDAEDHGIDGCMVTLKAPSDHEDQGGGTERPIFVTLKFPSDHDEDVPYAGQYPDVQTEKFPSDAEDHSINTMREIPVTLKAPSDHEDGSSHGETVVTLKAPSDHEDGSAADPGPMTRKFPSDAEDTGSDDGGVVTLKFPSDAEDGGRYGPEEAGGNSVTLKFPSDAEDGGHAEPGPVTLKFPSDAEDGGEIDLGQVMTAKFPSDHEDGSARLKDTIAVTLKFPSDNDEGAFYSSGGGNITTAKFPSDEDEGMVKEV
jgi:hypothetical protein